MVYLKDEHKSIKVAYHVIINRLKFCDVWLGFPILYKPITQNLAQT